MPDETVAAPPVPPPTNTVGSLRLYDNPVRDRYELWSGEELIGVEGYEITDHGDVILLHTVVMERFGRQGYARQLVAYVLDDNRSRNRRVLPVCTYVRDFLTRFPQYHDVAGAPSTESSV